ncbi:uncharacterized protein LOC116290499 [Actinia tenebrosa]|uniref:Uncharacterized protein LOC116290499 n=1 Tax=Actinia tenebrosa TaxID=6105 RepID=A0A6P8HL64_ACTTE|nr:uncharacterized protein LOC116290499 [Actinia tenebrosa]
MDKSSTNSLNSRRNFKLPPIQGALPTTLYGDRAWKSNNKPSLSTHGSIQPHVRIKESIPSRDFHSLHHATLRKRVDPFAKKTTTLASSRQHTATVEFNLGHEFPKSYSVLPPISKDTRTKDNENSCLLSATKINPVKRESRTTDKKYHSTASELLSERRRVRLLEKQQAQNGIEQDQCGAKTESRSRTHKETEPYAKTSKTEEAKETVNRKPSATYLLYIKSNRKDRRGGVCPENESGLINVTEQLKEIFLRRNMEEMYLI